MAYKIKTFTKGRVSAGRIRKLKKDKRKASNLQLERLGRILFNRVMYNISKPSIPLSTLAYRGFPYSKKRNRSINTSKLGGLKNYQIMTRSGKLSESLDYSVVSSQFSSQQILYIFFKPNSPAYVKYVIQGTEIMFGRDVINETLSRTNKDEVIDFISSGIKNSDAVLNQRDIRKLLRFGR